MRTTCPHAVREEMVLLTNVRLINSHILWFKFHPQIVLHAQIHTAIFSKQEKQNMFDACTYTTTNIEEWISAFTLALLKPVVNLRYKATQIIQAF